MKIRAGMTANQLIKEMDGCGVLGAGRLARATSIMEELFKEPDYTVFLTIAGPMIPGGLRRIVSELVSGEYINAIVTSGANVVHDIIEGLGYKGIKGSFLADDVKLRRKKIGRVGDIYLEQKGFEALEKKMYEIFLSVQQSGVDRISIYQLIFEIGKSLEDNESVLRKATSHNVPIFSPGLLDSMIGLHLWTFNQLNRIYIDPVMDLNELSNIIYKSKKVGAIILGGGLPKHHVLGVNILRDGVDAAIQITLDRPEGGSLSGASLEEAISWKKAKVEKKLETVIGDATLIFPIMVAAALERL